MNLKRGRSGRDGRREEVDSDSLVSAPVGLFSGEKVFVFDERRDQYFTSHHPPESTPFQ